MKTRAQAIRKLKEWKIPGYIYQFEAGHWDCCSDASPVGQALAENGYIYPRLDCRARFFEHRDS